MIEIIKSSLGLIGIIGSGIISILTCYMIILQIIKLRKEIRLLNKKIASDDISPKEKEIIDNQITATKYHVTVLFKFFTTTTIIIILLLFISLHSIMTINKYEPKIKQLNQKVEYTEHELKSVSKISNYNEILRRPFFEDSTGNRFIANFFEKGALRKLVCFNTGKEIIWDEMPNSPVFIVEKDTTSTIEESVNWLKNNRLDKYLNLILK